MALEIMVYKRKRALWLFLVPAFAFMAIFMYYPFLVNIVNSFFQIRELGGQRQEWNDFENYKALFTDPDMITALLNTVKLTVIVIVFQVGIALVLALMVDNIPRGAHVFRTVFFFPIVISATALGLLFNLLYLYPTGPLNQLLAPLFGGEPIVWKGEGTAFVAMVIPVVWQYVGFYFVIILTGLNNISTDVYEAAAIDGATGWRKIRFVTLPLVYNVLTTCVTLAVTGALKVFDLPWTMFPSGMPVGETFLTGTYMYQIAFNNQNVDYACTIAILIVALGVAMSQICNRVFKPKDY